MKRQDRLDFLRTNIRFERSGEKTNKERHWKIKKGYEKGRETRKFDV
jgi:hypothetical protein